MDCFYGLTRSFGSVTGVCESECSSIGGGGDEDDDADSEETGGRVPLPLPLDPLSRGLSSSLRAAPTRCERVFLRL